MGGGHAGPEVATAAEQGQEAKRAAAAAYDYEADPRWADYWSNVLVPPHLAARPDVLAHFRRKFYQRFLVQGVLEVIDGELRFVLCNTVEKHHADLLVIASHGYGAIKRNAYPSGQLKQVYSSPQIARPGHECEMLCMIMALEHVCPSPTCRLSTIRLYVVLVIFFRGWGHLNLDVMFYVI